MQCNPQFYGRDERKNPARPAFSEAFRSEKYIKARLHPTSKWAMRKDKFLWPRAFSGISSLAPSIMMCAHLRTTFFWCWENLTAKHTAWNADSLCSLLRFIFSRVTSVNGNERLFFTTHVDQLMFRHLMTD